MARKQLGAAPTNDTDATTKAYVDAATVGTSVTLNDPQTLTNKTLVGPIIDGYTEGLIPLGVVGAFQALSLASGTVITATLTSSILTTFTMPPVVAGQSFVLMLTQPGSTGGYGSAAFAGVQWSAQGAPTITITPGLMDIISFFSDGMNWYGSFVQGYPTGFDSTAGAKTSITLPNPGNRTYPILRTIRKVGTVGS